MRTSWLTVATLLATCAAALGTPDFCRLEPEPGHCNEEEARWYYNVKAGDCVRFFYYGCGGNFNNFRSKTECLAKCFGAKEEDKPKGDTGTVVNIVKEEEVDDDIDLSSIDGDVKDLEALQEMASSLPVGTISPMDTNIKKEVKVEPIAETEGDKPEMKVVKEIDDDESQVDFDKLHIKNNADKETLKQMMAQKDVPVTEVSVAEEAEEKNEPEIQAKIVKEEEDDSEVDLGKYSVTNENDKATLEQLMAQDGFPVNEMITIAEQEKMNENDNERPAIKVVETIDEDDTPVDFERLHITNENDKATLEQLLAQEGIPVDEVIPMKPETVPEVMESPRHAKIVKEVEDDADIDLEKYHIPNANDKAVLEEIMAQEGYPVNEIVPVEEDNREVENEEIVEEPRIKVVKTIDDDETPIDFERLHITNENDKATLEQLMAQEGIPVDEVLPVDNKPEKEEGEVEGPIAKIVKEEEDDSDVDLDKYHITNKDDKSTLEQLMAQEGFPINEVVLADEEVRPKNPESEERSIKVVKTIDNDDTPVDFERLHISNENDKATLEQLLAQEGIPVDEILPVEEETIETEKEDAGPVAKIVEEVYDESDVDLNKYKGLDENDKASLEEIMAQEGYPVNEIVPLADNVENTENMKPKIQVVETIDNDESDIDFDRLHITNENDKATLEQLLAQEGLPVDEIVPVESESEPKEEGTTVARIVKEEDDDSDIDLDKYHISNENDKAALEELMAQEGFPVNEIVPMEKSEEQEKDEPYIKVVKTIDEDESGVNFERLHITNENDKATLEQLLAQEGIPVDEVIPVEGKDEVNDEEPRKEEVNEDMIKVVKTIDDDETPVDFERLHITNENDKATLEQLIAQEGIPVDEVLPVEKEETPSFEGPRAKIVEKVEDDTDVDIDRLQITNPQDKLALEELLASSLPVEEMVPVNEDKSKNDEHKPIKVVEEVDNDETPIDFSNFHITNENDLSTLQDLIAQQGIPVDQVTPVEQQTKEKDYKKGKMGPKHHKSNSAFDHFQRMRDQYKKQKPYGKMEKLGRAEDSPMQPFFKNKIIIEETTEETSTTYLAPQESRNGHLPPCCRLPPAQGPCGQNSMQWHYDPSLQTCVPFTYGGCGGNKNRFDTIGDCLRKCGGITRKEPFNPSPFKEGPPMNMMPLINPYKALLTAMSPRLDIFRPEAERTTPAPEEMRGSGPIIRFFFHRHQSGPERMVEPSERRGPPSRPHMRQPMPPPPSHRRPPPPQVNRFNRRHEEHHFAPQFHKEVVMAPESFDNRFQQHHRPNNRLTLVQVFVNKHGRGMRGRKPWDPPSTSPRNSMGGAQRSGLRPPTSSKAWWNRFNQQQRNRNMVEITTYPPDYEPWPTNAAQNQATLALVTDHPEEQVIMEEVGEEESSSGPSYVCLLPVETGPCKAMNEKWFFDQNTGKCSLFIYGGCRGNANRFNTEEECKASCLVSASAEAAPEETTPYPDDVIVVTENVYGPVGEREDQDASAADKTVETVKDEPVTPDPMAVDINEKVMEKEETEVEPEVAVKEQQQEEVTVSEAAPGVSRLQLSSEAEYIIIITVMALVGIIVIFLTAFTVAHLSKKCKKSKKERIVEAVLSSHYSSTQDIPKLVYYGHTIVPPTQDPEVPDVHTLNNSDKQLAEENEYV